ncbi:MAG: alpha/beta hydrolase [Bacteroidetes bacterium]|nr:alpha/beta hydrolase [Bacteroidota bacterium]
MKYMAIVLMLLAGCQMQQNDETGKLDKYPVFPSDYVPARNLEVWLPSDYDPEKPEGYAVLYMHDGQNLFDTATANIGEEWGVDETMSRLLREGKIRDCIVVGMWCTPDRMLEYTPAKPYNLMIEKRLQTGREEEDSVEQPGGDDYLRFIVEEVKPFIDSVYNADPGKESTFIAGSSMGGLISLYALMEYPDVFSGAACLSTHWPLRIQENSPDFVRAYVQYLDERLSVDNGQKIYFDYGTETLDSWYEPYQMIIDSLMRSKGFGESNWKTLKFEGGVHNEVAWRERFDIPVVFLLGQR